MRDNFIDIDMEYDVDALAAMYDTTMLSKTPVFSLLDSDITTSEIVSELFNRFNLPLNNNHCSLTTIRRPVAIHTNPGSNGLIIFPLTGDLQVDFYSVDAPIIDGITMLTPYLKERPPIPQKDINAILDSKFASKIIKKPIAINGRKIYSYSPVNGTIPLVFLLKIPFGVEWEKIQTIAEEINA